MFNLGSCKIRLGKAADVLRKLEWRPDLAAYFGMAGPDAAKLKQGWALYHGADAAYIGRARKYADALGAIDRCAASFQAARALQTRITALARVLITTPSDRDRLGLSGRRAEGLAGWRVQAEIFHANLTDADRALLAEVGVDTAVLDRAAALLAQLAVDHATRVAAKAQAKAASAAKAAAFQELAAFMSVLINIARALEADVPDLIAFLGMRPDKRRHRSPVAGTGQASLPSGEVGRVPDSNWSILAKTSDESGLDTGVVLGAESTLVSPFPEPITAPSSAPGPGSKDIQGLVGSRRKNDGGQDPVTNSKRGRRRKRRSGTRFG